MRTIWTRSRPWGFKYDYLDTMHTSNKPSCKYCISNSTIRSGRADFCCSSCLATRLTSSRYAPCSLTASLLLLCIRRQFLDLVLLVLPRDGDKLCVTAASDEVALRICEFDPRVRERLAETVAGKVTVQCVADLACGLDVRYRQVRRNARAEESSARDGERAASVYETREHAAMDDGESILRAIRTKTPTRQLLLHHHHQQTSWFIVQEEVGRVVQQFWHFTQWWGSIVREAWTWPGVAETMESDLSKCGSMPLVVRKDDHTFCTNGKALLVMAARRPTRSM